MMCAQQRKGIFHSNVWKDPTERYSSASLQFPCYGSPGTPVHGSYEYSYGRADGDQHQPEGGTYRGASWVAPSRPKVSWSRRACVAARPVSQEGPQGCTVAGRLLGEGVALLAACDMPVLR